MSQGKRKREKGKRKKEKGKRKKEKGKLEMDGCVRAGKRDIEERTFAFAPEVIRLCKLLDALPGVGWGLGKQLLRSATSIGANVEEAQAGQSRADFISKNAIALKEARETRYWLRLLRDGDIVHSDSVEKLILEADELTRILGAIVCRARENAR
jgi:four helix bundle protein